MIDPRLQDALNKAVEYMGEYKPSTSKEAQTAIYDVTCQLAVDDGLVLSDEDHKWIRSQAKYYS